MLWNKDEIMLRIRLVEKYFVHFLICSRDDQVWELTAMYASPNPRLRRNLWSDLDMIEVCYPWLIIGDFNCILSDGERNSIGGVPSSFSRWTDERGLIDLRYVGPRFTWNHS